MAKFTINEFRVKYPTDDACLDAIFQIRYGKLTTCPKCNENACISKVSNRRCYQCSKCHSQFYPTAGTIFEKTRTPLINWLFVIHLFTTTRNGVAAKEIQRQLGVTYKCAWRMGHQVRQLIGGMSNDVITGIVELDECVTGGVAANMHSSRKKKLIKETGSISNKTVVFGMLERGVGVRAYVINKHVIDGKDLHPIIRKKIDKDAMLMTDKSKVYDGLEKDYMRESVNHGYGEYVRDRHIHINGIEGFWSQVKRTIGGTHVQVSRKYLQQYVNECAFRYNNVFRGEKMFDEILSHLPPAVKKKYNKPK